MSTNLSNVITTWGIDNTHSEVQFKVKHLVISTVTGSFKSFDAKVESESDDFSNANIAFSLDVNSIDTNQEQRDGHLKSADFFDAANFPKITFQSASFTKKSANEYLLKGNLTIKNTTKEVELSVEYGGSATDFYGNVKAGFEVQGKISRKAFGLTWDAVTEAGAIVVGDEIKLALNIQLVKQA